MTSWRGNDSPSNTIATNCDVAFVSLFTIPVPKIPEQTQYRCNADNLADVQRKFNDSSRLTLDIFTDNN